MTVLTSLEALKHQIELLAVLNEKRTDNAPVLAAIAALQAQLEALPTPSNQGTDYSSAIAAIQTSINGLSLGVADSNAHLLALGTEQGAIGAQLLGLRNQLLVVLASEVESKTRDLALSAGQESLASKLLAVEQAQTQMAASVSAILALVTPPTPAPTPAPTPKASTTPYAASYSSAFAGYEPSYARLTDGNYSNGSLTNYGNSWIKATFPAPILVSGVSVGGGHDPNNGDLRLTGLQLQYSTNDLDWITLTTIVGNYSSGNVVFTYQVDPAITAQYWRLYKAADYVWISEFLFTP